MVVCARRRGGAGEADLKILVVTHGFPPDQMAGAEIYAFHLARGFRARGEEVVVFSPGRREGLEEYAVREEEVEGLRVLRMQNAFRDIHSLEDTYAHPAIEARFAEILDRERPDLVHLHHVIGTAAATAPLARARGIPVVITLHDYWFHCARGQRITPRGHLCTRVQPWRCALCVGKKRGRYAFDWTFAFLGGRARDAAGRGGPRRWLEFPFRGAARLLRELTTRPIRARLGAMDRALEAADVLLCPSEFLLERYRERGAPDRKLRFWENGMETAHLEGFAREPRAPGEPIRFGFVGTLLRTKGIELLLEAFAGLDPALARLEIHGAASGPDPAGYERRLRARAAGHPGIRFHGRFPNAELARVLAGLDVLVVPSLWWENAPLTLHEAALVGMPVVTAGHGGMEEFVARFGTGVTFAPGDAASLRAALEGLASEPERLAGLSTPRRPVRRLEDDVSGLLDLYRDLVAASAAKKSPGSPGSR
ncbi:MAG: glycosyltransferase family 4 protein [Planctomycetota bacterium]